MSIPLRLSEGRGNYQQAKLQMESWHLELVAKQTQLQLKLQQQFAEFEQIQLQLAVQRQMFRNTRILQTGEETKFTNGESSLFLVNARQQKVIEVQEKIFMLEAKLEKSLVAVRWAAGDLLRSDAPRPRP